MDMQAIYQERIEKLEAELEKVKLNAKRLPLFRLLTLGLAIGLLFILYPIEPFLGWFGLIGGLFAFGKVIQRDIKVNKQIKRLEVLLLINTQELELNSLGGDRDGFDGGDEFIDKKHRYIHDLDIFGDSSIFKLVNRTTSRPGKELLAIWLSDKANNETIKARQEAIKELGEKVDWRHEFRTAGMLHKNTGLSHETILEWLEEDNKFVNKKALVWATTILPIVTVAVGIASIFFISEYFFYGLLTLQGGLIWKFKEDIASVYAKTSRQVGLLRSYSDLIGQIEKEEFNSALLIQIKEKLKAGERTASGNIDTLVRYLNYLDYKLNILVYIPLALIGMWDFQWLIRLERWKNLHGKKVENWFEALAEFEALSSLANLNYNYPNWVLPEISEEELVVEGKALGHPLIPEFQRISNDVNIDKKGKILLVTGSNMAGKSTYLRTVGVNMVLAHAGAPVCAESFTVSQTGIFTSMRISDSLEDNTSSFYAELKRLKAVIEVVESGENIIFLLDEILRGTNSNDRHVGSEALIRQMIKANGAGILATHDLELGRLESEYPDNIENWSFDVQVDGEELYFDYKIHPGICTSLNASILMKKMGIKVD